MSQMENSIQSELDERDRPLTLDEKISVVGAKFSSTRSDTIAAN